MLDCFLLSNKYTNKYLIQQFRENVSMKRMSPLANLFILTPKPSINPFVTYFRMKSNNKFKFQT